MTIHSLGKAQIVLLLVKEITILTEYSDFANAFSKKLAEVISKCIEINKHAIKYVNAKQLLYKPIYSLRPLEHEILKIYIKINLANSFICFSKSSTGALIIFF